MKLKGHHKKLTANLQKYLEEKFQDANSRIITIFQAITIVNTIEAKTVEKLFFNILVEFIKIDHVIPYIMNLNSKENRQTIKTENDVDSNNEASFFAKNHEENRSFSTYGDY